MSKILKLKSLGTLRLKIIESIFAILFPRFNELRFAIIASIFVFVPYNGVPLSAQYLQTIYQYIAPGPITNTYMADLMFPLTVLYFALYLGYKDVYSKKQISNQDKNFMLYIYYFIFALCSYATLFHAGYQNMSEPSWVDSLNESIVVIMLVLPIIRTAVLYGTKPPSPWYKLTVKNFSNKQAKTYQLLMGFGVSGLVLLVLSESYDSPWQLIVLGYTYSYAAVRLLSVSGLYIKNLFPHIKNSSS